MIHRAFTRYVLLAATMLLTGCNGCKHGNGSDYDLEDDEDEMEVIADHITEEYLNSFGSADGGHHTFNGNSQPIDITPCDGLHVTAQENAFEHDTEIKITGVSDETYEQLKKQCEEARLNMLMAFDVNCGLADNEVMPGVYRVEMDLKKMGVPKELYDELCVCRINDEGKMIEYHSWVKNDKLIYESAMNSKVVAGLKWFGSWAWKSVAKGKSWLHGAVFIPFAYYLGSTALRQYVLAPFKQYYISNGGRPYIINVKDEFGDFNIVYNQRLCENGSTTSPYTKDGKDKEEALDEQLYKVRAKAMAKVNKMVDEAGQAGNPGWFQSQKQRNEMRASINFQKVYDELCAEDKVLSSLLSDKYFSVPESVAEMILLEKLANRYLVKVLGFKKMWYTFDIYLSNDQFMKPDPTSVPAAGVTVPLDGWFTFMAVAYSKIVEQKEMADPLDKKWKNKRTVGTQLNRDRLNAMLVTLCHESFHMQQYRYMFSTLFKKEQRLCEATAVILERQFVEWLKKQNELKAERGADVSITDTDDLFWLAWTLERPIPTNAAGKDIVSMIKTFLGASDPQNTDMGYMLGEFIQYLLDHKNKKVTLLKIFENYNYSKGFAGMLRDVFGFKNDNEFYEFYERFCKEHLNDIVTKQTASNDALNEGMLDTPKKIDYVTPVYRISNIAMQKTEHKARPFAIRTYQFVPKFAQDIDMRRKKYNMLLVPSPAVNDSVLKTFLLTPDVKWPKDSLHFREINKDRKKLTPVPANVVMLYKPGIYEETIDDSWWVDAIALFEPEKPSVSYDHVHERLLVMHNMKPCDKLFKRDYVSDLSGLQLVVKDNKTGRKKTDKMTLLAWHKYFDVFLRDMGIDPNGDVDISLSTRWFLYLENGETYYGPASEKVQYTKKGKQNANENVNEEEENEEEEGEPIVIIGPEAQKDGYDVEFDLNNIGTFSLTGDGYDQAQKVKAHLIIDSHQFSLTVPKSTFIRKPHKELEIKYEIDGFSIRGKAVAVKNHQGEMDYYVCDRHDLTVTGKLHVKETKTASDGRKVVDERTFTYVREPNGSEKDFIPTDGKNARINLPIKAGNWKKGDQVQQKTNCTFTIGGKVRGR